MARAFPDRFYANENFHALAELPEIVERGQGRARHRLDQGGREGAQACRWAPRRPSADDDPAPCAGWTGRGDPASCSRPASSLRSEDIDLCLILGAGWPFIDGGASPYLDREGASERAFGDTFHHPVIKGIARRSKRDGGPGFEGSGPPACPARLLVRRHTF